MNFSPRRAHRHAERQRVGVGALGQRRGGIDRELVGERRQGGQHARAAHDDAVLGVGDLVQGVDIAGRRRVAGRLVDGRLHDGVGERDVAAAQELLVGDQPLGAGLVAVEAPFVGPAGEAGKGDVHVVGRAAHQAHRILGDLAQRLAAARQILARARDHVADRDRLAGLRVRHQADLGMLVMEVEDLGQRMGGAAELGMVDDVGNALAVDPDLAGAAKAFQEFLARACRHRSALFQKRDFTRPAWSRQAAAASPPWRTRLRAWDGRAATARWRSGSRDSPARSRW